MLNTKFFTISLWYLGEMSGRNKKCSNNFFSWLFVYSYVPYAKPHCAQSGVCAFRLGSKLSGFDWGTQLTCGCRHVPQTGPLTPVMPAESAARGARYSSQTPRRNKVQMLCHAPALDTLSMMLVT